MPNDATLKELAQAMNNLAGTLKETNILARELRKQAEEWEAIPVILTELNKRIAVLSTRIK